jgi:hypothetical protein
MRQWCASVTDLFRAQSKREIFNLNSHIFRPSQIQMGRGGIVAAVRHNHNQFEVCYSIVPTVGYACMSWHKFVESKLTQKALILG